MKITYLLSSPWIRPDMTLRIILSLPINTVLCIILSFASSNNFVQQFHYFQKSFSNRISTLWYHHPKLPLQLGQHILHNLIVVLSSRMRFVYTSSSSQPSLHQCCFAVGTPCRRSRSSCQFYVLRLSLVFL